MAIEVHRTGTLSGDSLGSKIADAIIKAEYGTARLVFKTPRGEGDSLYSLMIGPDSYADVIRSMLHADPDQALKAIGAALQDGVPKRAGNGEFWAPSRAA
jgi:hypothetical protein